MPKSIIDSSLIHTNIHTYAYMCTYQTNTHRHIDTCEQRHRHINRQTDATDRQTPQTHSNVLPVQ